MYGEGLVPRNAAVDHCRLDGIILAIGSRDMDIMAGGHAIRRHRKARASDKCKEHDQYMCLKSDKCQPDWKLVKYRKRKRGKSGRL